MEPDTEKQKAVRAEMERVTAQAIFDGMGGGGGCDETIADMGADLAVHYASDAVRALIEGPLKQWWKGLR